MDKQAHKKTALITGGTSGIGLATAIALLSQDFQVAVVGRTWENWQKAVPFLTTDGHSAMFFSGDLRFPSQCQEVIQQTIQAFGSLHVLVNSAGIYSEQPISQVTEEDFDQLMATNVKSTFFMCKYAFPELKKQPGSSIVNISSDAGLTGNFHCAAYCASKGAITLLTKSLALEFSPAGVRVNCVCPGDVDTPMTQKQWQYSFPSPTEAKKEMTALYPLGRIGQPKDIAAVISFLTSDAASWVTGAAWSVDGGLTAY